MVEVWIFPLGSSKLLFVYIFWLLSRFMLTVTDPRNKQPEMSLNSILSLPGHTYLHSVKQATEFLNCAVQQYIFKTQGGLKRMIFYSNKKRKRNYELNRVLKTYTGWKRNSSELLKKLVTCRFYHLFPPPQRNVLLSTQTEELPFNQIKGSAVKNRKGKKEKSDIPTNQPISTAHFIIRQNKEQNGWFQRGKAPETMFS